MLEVDFDGKQIEDFLRPFAPKSVNQAKRRAVNTAASKARTKASVLIREKWNLPAGFINKRLGLEIKSSGYSDLAVLKTTSRPVSLSYFGAVWYLPDKEGSGARKVTRKTGRRLKKSGGKSGVYVTVEKASGDTHFANSFIAAGRRGGGLTDAGVQKTGSSGFVGVFERAGKKRIPILARKSITVPSMFLQKRVYDPVVELIGDVYKREFYRQLGL